MDGRQKRNQRLDRFRPVWLLPFVVALLTAACSGVPVTVTPPGSDQSHLVSAGQNLNLIAARHFQNPKDIARLNNLSPPYDLVIGQRLVIPPYRLHTVVMGDSTTGIAQTYGIVEQDLIVLNRISNADLKLGQKLRIPANTRTQVSVRDASVQQQTLPGLTTNLGTTPGNVTTQAVPLPTVETQRSFVDITIVHAPTRRLPTATSTTRIAAAKAETLTANAPAVSNNTKAIKIVEVLPRQRTQVNTQAGVVTATIDTPKNAVLQAAANMDQIIWPVDGTILSPFGGKAAGRHNDGINIAAMAGSPVRAAADGIVVYAGDKLSAGFGNILILRHKDNLMTAYAHNQALLVDEGQIIRQGQVVARSGQTGDVLSPQLHFEVREGTQPVDPMRYLPAR